MLKYIKEFANHTAYQSAESSLDKPNVSLCVQEDEVHYNPWVDNRLIATFNITSTSNPTTIMYSGSISQFTEIEIDGIVQPSVVSSYTFDTLGEHTVKYTLLDPTSIGESAFVGCDYSLTSITIPDSVTNIGNYAFQNCRRLTNITIPDSVTSIGSSAFNYCTSFTSITIPSSVTSIGGHAFQYCYNSTSLTIGNGITSIGDYAFQGCSVLTSVTVEAQNPPTLGSGIFGNNASGRKIYVPAESVNAYKAASGWSSYVSDIEAIPTT